MGRSQCAGGNNLMRPKIPTRLTPILSDVRRRAAERRSAQSLKELQHAVRPVPERHERF